MAFGLLRGGSLQSIEAFDVTFEIAGERVEESPQWARANGATITMIVFDGEGHSLSK